MKITLFIVISLNGYIARENGNEDFLSEDNWALFVQEAKKVGAIIWGRTTYERVRTWDLHYLQDLQDVVKIIVSSDKEYTVEQGFSLVTSPSEAVQKLSHMGFDHAIITGGSTLNAGFAKEKLIDEIIVNVEPYILGEGIHLFKQDDFEFKLNLLSVKQMDSGILQLRYRVEK
ncbi:hypothetical protein C5B42_00145 [Candidatus Cerribacteria bacterium 'Amazon FNV 2010 28 9']|uniref:Bacterial bifunctional deaminase-reductase C-terminal domain-containing protein n=1 Tax=Candidatus Cerribacteria bacterium 'Amazon FNV 2010 28 9' TaxID=2081795 RepID=A0A317JRR4_9BACT|nr:MAG: hypothetical protein C5B42_00145 [Candidatus Cerribacteria bacterium 'Amazon FNV 2010 28 9']